MILITPDRNISELTALMESLKKSIADLRNAAEDLKTRIETGEDTQIAAGKKQVMECAGLIRNCQTVEAQLVKLHCNETGIAQGGYALDLDAARAEVGCRLARLRACADTDEVSG